MLKKQLSFLFLLTFLCGHVYAQTESGAQDDDTFLMPGMEVTAAREKTGDLITQEDMRRDGAKDLWEAVRHTPGVILSGGGTRNESNFRIRGYGPNSVPIIVDGVQVANPYRREGDAARVLIGDLESVTIHKGYSSMLLGANTLGGAVVLRTAKPQQKFELYLQPEVEADSRFNYASNTIVASAGTKRELYYGKVTYQRRDTDHFRLPDSFEPTLGNPQQKGDRMWSDSIDTKVTVMAGITPKANLDIWATYVLQDADKGFSPPETVIRDYLIWEWPIWKRSSYSLNGEYSFRDFSFEALVYYDKYDNRMQEYASMAHLVLLGKHQEPSDYDEYSAGGRVLAGWDINSRNKLQASVVYKKEDHRGLREHRGEMEELIHVNEDTWSLGMEYTAKPWQRFTLEAGFGYDALYPREYWSDENEFAKLIDAGYFVVKTDKMFLYKWQFGGFYEIMEGHELHLTYARKNHFPNMSQRYSTRFGDVLPNPNLKAEIADHFEFGYKGRVNDMLSLAPAVYYSLMDGKIVNFKIPDPTNPTVHVDYAMNLDKTSFYGFELSAGLENLSDYFSAGLTFSVNEYKLNKTQSSDVLVMSYYPEITASGYLSITPLRKLEIIPRVEYVSSRYENTTGTNRLSSYWLANIRVKYDLCDSLSAVAGFNNIFDKYYEIRYHYPQAGRSYTLSLTYNY